MILRRVIAHVRDQNWSALALAVSIAIVTAHEPAEAYR